ncbi:MAG: hypothetical protein ACOY7T_10135 [Pseudomonadota bacterium]
MKDLEIIRVIGKEAAIALAEEFAGTRLYIPANVGDDHPITAAIGREAADKLCAHYSPTTICVPLLREARAVHHRCKGLSHAKIAVRLGVTEKAIERIFLRRRQREGVTSQ